MSVADFTGRVRTAAGSRAMQIGFVGVGVALLMPLVVADRAIMGLAVVFGLLFLALSARNLLPVTLLLVVLAADTLGIFGVWGDQEALPYAQIMAGVRLTVRDALLATMFPVAVMELWRRRDVPVFTVSFIGVAAAITVAFLLGTLSDRSTHTPLNMMRPLFGYTLYFIMVAAVDSRRKLDWILAAIFCVVGLSVAIQLYEAYLGMPLPFLALPLWLLHAGVDSYNGEVPYLWNRAMFHMFLTLFLALGCLLEWRGARLHAGVAMICLVGFVFMLTRSWYIFIAVGVLAMLFVCRGWQPRARFGLAVLALAAGVVIVGTLTREFTADTYGGSLVDVWTARVQTLLAFQNERNYQTRVETVDQQWKEVLAAPLFGYGLSQRAEALIDPDTGSANTLIQFGLVGFAAFVILIGHAVRMALMCSKRLPPSRGRGYALGLVGAWAGLLTGYAFNWDFFTHPHGPWLVVLSLAVGDRIWYVYGASKGTTTGDDSYRRLARLQSL